MRTAVTSFAVACAVLMSSSTAWADANTVAAEAAFQRATKLRAENKWAEACEAFKQSNQLDPQFGTAFNLAGCYLQLKKLVLAWSTYSELAQKDTNAGRKAKAAQLVKELAPRLSWIKLEGSAPQPDGFAVTIDSEAMTKLVGVDTPFDLGAHTVTATANGMEPFTETVTLEKEGQRVVVTIPAFAPVKTTELPPAKKEVAVVTPEVETAAHQSVELTTKSPWVIAFTATAGLYAAPPGSEHAPALAFGAGAAFGRAVSESIAIIGAANGDVVLDQATFQRVFVGAGIRFDRGRIGLQLTPGLSVLTGASETVMGFGVDAGATWAFSTNLGITLHVNASSVGQPEGFMGNLTVLRLGAGMSYRL
jgi:hypothetical protein